jgi:thiamine biosynthesis lipoprotein
MLLGRAIKTAATLAAVLLAGLGACDRDTERVTHDLSGDTMGTTFNVLLVAPPVSVSLDSLQSEITATLERIENIASTYRETSELSKFNANSSTDWIDASAEFCDLIYQALYVSQETAGAFDITVGPLVNLWGFGPDPAAIQPPSPEQIDAALRHVGFRKLQADCAQPAVRKSSASMYVDLSGWAKGHAVDRVAGLLDQNGLENYLVEIGGELRVHGHNAENREFAIALEKPVPGQGDEYSIVRVSNAGIATSGDYRNYFENDGQLFSHIIDPRTGSPINHELAAVTVVGDTTAYADAMATALLVLGPGDGLALAENLGVAAYFSVRTDQGIESFSSSAFSAGNFANHARM